MEKDWIWDTLQPIVINWVKNACRPVIYWILVRSIYLWDILTIIIGGAGAVVLAFSVIAESDIQFSGTTPAAGVNQILFTVGIWLICGGYACQLIGMILKSEWIKKTRSGVRLLAWRERLKAQRQLKPYPMP